MALTISMVAVGFTALTLPLAIDTTNLAGKDANYILGFALAIVSLTVVVLAKYIKDMQGVLIGIAKDQAASATRVADALAPLPDAVNKLTTAAKWCEHNALKRPSE